MKFRTILETNTSKKLINHKDKILLIGSCFSQNIGNYLQNSGFHITINPFGTLFHPIPICKCIEHAIDEKNYTIDDLIAYESKFYSTYHAKQSNTNLEEILHSINEQRKLTTDFLKNTRFLFLTFGTSFGYFYKKTDQMVANCYKIPNHSFDKKFTDTEILSSETTPIFHKLNEFNKNLQIILTVSPVKHIRDGLVENSFSKANILSYARKLLQTFQNMEYFPAYELLQEDLRDYRFYENDLIHPNNMAIDYIIQYFEKTYFTIDTQQIVNKFKKLNLALNHRIQDGETNQSFNNYALRIIQELESGGFSLENAKKHFGL